MGRQSATESQSQSHYVRMLFRILIVGLAWFVASLVPDSSKGYFQTLFLASVTSWYEYGIIFLDSQGKFRRMMSFLGIIGSVLFAIFAFGGLVGWVKLDIVADYFTLGPMIPVRNAGTVHWDYFSFVKFMWLIPLFTFAELPLRKEAAAPVKASKHRVS